MTDLGLFGPGAVHAGAGGGEKIGEPFGHALNTPLKVEICSLSFT